MARIEHRNIPDGQRHEPKGISNAPSGTVYFADGSGSGEWRLPESFEQDAVIVRKKEDFGEIAGNTINITGISVFRIQGEIFMQDTVFLIQPGALLVLLGDSAFKDKISSNTGNDLFTGTDCAVSYRNVSFSAPNARIFNVSDVVSSQTAGVLENCIIEQCRRVGIFDDMNLFAISNCLFGSISESPGLLYSGSGTGTIAVDDNIFELYTGTLIDLGSVVSQTIRISGNKVTNSPGNVLLDGQIDNGNLTGLGTGQVLGNTAFGEETVINNITDDDLRWEFRGNSGIANSVARGINKLSAPAGNGGPAAGTFLEVGTDFGAMVLQFSSSRFVLPAGTGRLRTREKRDGVYAVNVSLSLSTSGGPTRDVTIRLTKNGSGIAGGEIATETTSDLRAVSLIAVVNGKDGDEFGVSVANTENTSEITVGDCTLTAYKIG